MSFTDRASREAAPGRLGHPPRVSGVRARPMKKKKARARARARGRRASLTHLDGVTLAHVHRHDDRLAVGLDGLRRAVLLREGEEGRGGGVASVPRLACARCTRKKKKVAGVERQAHASARTMTTCTVRACGGGWREVGQRGSVGSASCHGAREAAARPCASAALTGPCAPAPPAPPHCRKTPPSTTLAARHTRAGERGGAGARSHLGGGGRRGARLERHAAERRAERGHGCSRGGVPRARFGCPCPAPPPRTRAAGRHAAFFFARPRADRAPRACECILMIRDAFFFFFGPRPGASSRRSRPGHHRARASPAGGLT